MNENPINLNEIIAPAFYNVFGISWMISILTMTYTADVDPQNHPLWGS